MSDCPYMTIKEAARTFGVSYTSVYRSRGVFAALRKVSINGSLRVMREDVEALDRQLKQSAIAANPDAASLRNVRAYKRKRAVRQIED